MAGTRFDEAVVMASTLTIGDTSISAQERTSILKQTANVVYPIPWADLRVWDAYATNLPATAASDDLGLVGGTFGTNQPLITAGDVKALGATNRYARFQVKLPGVYEAGQTVSIVVTGGMQTTVADTTCTVDIEAYRVDKDNSISADLCATAAQTINSLTFAAKTFTITATTLGPGDVLDVRVTIASNDGGTGTAVTPTISGLDLYCDIR